MFRVAYVMHRLGDAMRDISDGKDPTKWFREADESMMNFIRKHALKSAEPYSPVTRFRVILVWKI